MGFFDRLLGRRGTDPLEQPQLTRRVVQSLQAGMTAVEIEGDLIEQGMSPHQARRLVKVAIEVRDRGVHLFDESA